MLRELARLTNPFSQDGMATRWSERDIAAVRRLFEVHGLTPAEIAAATGLATETIRRRAKRAGWQAPSAEDTEAASLPILEEPASHRPMTERRRALAERALVVAERHMQHIEARLARGLGDVADEERGARVLAVMIRTLRELAALELRATTKPDDEEAADDEPVAGRDDALRAAFARRLEELFGDREPAALSG